MLLLTQSLYALRHHHTGDAYCRHECSRVQKQFGRVDRPSKMYSTFVPHTGDQTAARPRNLPPRLLLTPIDTSKLHEDVEHATDTIFKSSAYGAPHQLTVAATRKQGCRG
jgi:hypothetical protein